jgi:hypothetical protein
VTKLADYVAMPNGAFWAPPPGEPMHGISVVDPAVWPRWPQSLDELSDALIKIEMRIALGHRLNTPHACSYEGPWTRCSCHECDIRDGKALMALFSFLFERQDLLDLLRPAPFVHCMHEGASRYAPCKECCRVIRIVGARLEDAFSFVNKPLFHYEPLLHDSAKRSAWWWADMGRY